ncbi:hypothetical protein [Streptomyces sp. PsTaAH-124]|uniref:hypothetical protein n=1 Tax=Streptomyces sp. PsTaAH-124 TaxID=1157638 RepID=UPI000378A954|nr:hypothetical protein [Streptomyces sp. PsTaAH-124]
MDSSAFVTAARQKSGRQHTGGFQATREFGFALEKRFPDLDLTSVDTEGLALIVEITDTRRLNLFKLSKVLTAVAKGGVKTAVITVKDRPDFQKAVPLFNLFMMVDEGAQLKEMTKLERAIRTGV